MSPLSELFKAAFISTSKGAGVTLGSTVGSCYLACQIESNAHKFIYHHWPEKYATVEYANGLTQEELDRAHQLKPAMVQPDTMVVLSDGAPAVEEEEDTKKTSRTPMYSLDLLGSTLDQTNQFWKEAEEPLAAIKDFSMPNQDLIACSMTS